jgi:EF hand
MNVNKKTILLLAAGALGLSAIGGIAFAARSHHGGQHGMMDLAERYDANKDGLVTQQEIDGNRAEWHAKFDADKNGNLSLDEFKALWAEANKERMVREFQRFDADGDSKLVLDEYKKPLATIVAEVDRNGDKALGKDDHMKRRGGRHHGGHGKDGGMMDGMPPAPPK